MSSRRRLGRLAARALLGLAVFWTLGEIAARSLNLVDRLNGFPRRLFVATDDARLPYRLRPNVDTIARGVRVRTNSLGLRGPEVSRRPPPGVHRILVLGDSVAFGYRLEREQAFPFRLERELERRSGGRYEVVNAAVEGYNTENELAVLERLGLSLSPETVVLAFNLNDFDYGPVMGPLGVLTTDRSQRVSRFSPANLSEFYLLLRWLGALALHAWRGSPTAVEGGAESGPFSRFDRYVSALRKRYYASPSDERWATMVSSLERIARLCRERGIRLVVAILPDGDQIGVAHPDLTPQRRLAEICQRLELECLDLYPRFASRAKREGDLYLDIMHPDAEGHEIIARSLAEALLRPARPRASRAAPRAGEPRAATSRPQPAAGSGMRRNAVTPTA